MYGIDHEPNSAEIDRKVRVRHHVDLVVRIRVQGAVAKASFPIPVSNLPYIRARAHKILDATLFSAGPAGGIMGSKPPPGSVLPITKAQQRKIFQVVDQVVAEWGTTVKEAPLPSE